MISHVGDQKGGRSEKCVVGSVKEIRACVIFLSEAKKLCNKACVKSYLEWCSDQITNYNVKT